MVNNEVKRWYQFRFAITLKGNIVAEPLFQKYSATLSLNSISPFAPATNICCGTKCFWKIKFLGQKMFPQQMLLMCASGETFGETILSCEGVTVVRIRKICQLEEPIRLQDSQNITRSNIEKKKAKIDFLRSHERQRRNLSVRNLGFGLNQIRD